MNMKTVLAIFLSFFGSESFAQSPSSFDWNRTIMRCTGDSGLSVTLSKRMHGNRQIIDGNDEPMFEILVKRGDEVLVKRTDIMEQNETSVSIWNEHGGKTEPGWYYSDYYARRVYRDAKKETQLFILQDGWSIFSRRLVKSGIHAFEDYHSYQYDLPREWIECTVYRD